MKRTQDYKDGYKAGVQEASIKMLGREILCDDCEIRTAHMMAGQAFTNYECHTCNKSMSHPNTAVPLNCKSCSAKEWKCQRCDNELGELLDD